MRLVEWLADEYYQTRPEGFGNPCSDFEAGFNKAIELACAQARVYAHLNLCPDGGCTDWLEPCQVVHDIRKIPDRDH